MPTRPGVECSWWRTTRIGRFSAAPSAITADRALESHAHLRRYREELGNPPDDIVLELMELAVREDQLPHHRDNLLTFALVESPLEHVGEAVKVDGLVVRVPRRRDQRLGLGAVEVESAGEEIAEKAPLLLRHDAVDGG